jgi:hypothetical protein
MMAVGVITNSGTIDNLAAVMQIGGKFESTFSVVNTGLIEATSGGSLLFDDGAVDGSGGGIILVGSGGEAQLQSTTLIGGTLKTQGTGIIVTTDSGDALVGTASAVNNQGAFTIAAGDSLAVSGVIHNTGTVTLGSSAALTVVGAATFSGAGKIMLAADGTSRILAGGAGASLTNANTLSGAGVIGAGVTLVNQAGGIIDANAASPLTIALAGATATNAGLIEAAAGGSLTLSGLTLDNAGGTLGALGGAVTLKGVDLVGGTLKSSGAGVIHVQTATLDGSAGAIANSGALSVNSGGSLTALGALANSGTLTLNGASLTAGAPGLTLTGKGKVLLSDSAGNLITGSTLTNAGNVIFGAGDIGGGSMNLVNAAGATIKATDATPLILDTGANVIVNAGTIESVAGGVGEVMSAVSNSQWLYAAGGSLTVEGAVTGSGKALIKSGTLTFASSFNQIVSFIGATGELVLAQSQAFTNFVRGFSRTGGTSLDLQDIAFGGATSASYSGTTTSGVLTVSDGTHTAHIHLQGDYTGSAFMVSSDGSGGTTVVDPPAAAAPLAQTLASFAVGPAPHETGTAPWRLARLPLICARV